MAIRCRDGRGANAIIQPHTMSAGATTSFSLLRRPAASAAALHHRRSCASAAYTASSTNSPAITPARPTMLATASTWTGCTANSSPAASAARSPRQRRDGHTRPGVPRDVHRVKPPGGAAELPLDGVRRERQGTIHPAPDDRRPVGAHERPPHAADLEYQVVEADDLVVVQSKLIPQGGDVHDRGADGHGGIQAPSAHAISRGGGTGYSEECGTSPPSRRAR